MSVTLTDLIKAVSMAYKKVWASDTTTSAGSTTTLVCSRLIGKQLGAGQWVQVAAADRRVVSFDDSTGTLTFTPAHTSAIASGSAFIVTPRSWDEMVAALTRAMYGMGESWQTVRATDSTSNLSGLRDTWDLPSDCNDVLRIQVKPRPPFTNMLTNVPYEQWEDWPYWEVFSVDGARKLRLTKLVAGPVRLHYRALIVVPTATNEYINFGDNDDREAVAFLVARTQYELLTADQIDNPAAQAARTWGAMAKQLFEISEGIRARRRPSAVVSGQVQLRPMPVQI